MERLSLFWIAWLIAEAISLQVAIAFLPADFSPLQPYHSAASFTESQPDHIDWRFKETSSVSQELNLQCARQSRQTRIPFRPIDPTSAPQPGGKRLQAALVPVSFSGRFFLPRKITPPSPED